MTDKKLQQREQKWKIYEELAISKELKKFLKNSRDIIRPPWIGLAIPANISTENQGETFCFQSLGIRNPFGLHVNGSFILTSNRKMIRDDNYWNKLLQNALAHSLCSFFFNLSRQITIKDIDTFMSKLPKPLNRSAFGSDKFWSHLAAKFLVIAYSKNLSVIYRFRDSDGFKNCENIILNDDKYWLSISDVVWVNETNIDLILNVLTRHNFPITQPKFNMIQPLQRCAIC